MLGGSPRLRRSMMAAADPGPSWTLAGSLTGIVQNKSVLLQPALTFDRGPLHLETRYNSDDRDTFSLFAVGTSSGASSSSHRCSAPWQGGRKALPGDRPDPDLGPVQSSRRR